MSSSSTSGDRDTVDLDIESLNLSGDGVARYRRQTIVVPFTIPGERVRVEVGRPKAAPTYAAPTYTPAALVEVLRPSPHRVQPRCQHFGPGQPGQARLCGGCSWQHIEYPEQLRLKTAIVEQIVRAAMPHAPAVRPMLAGTPLDEPWSYRHKVHFVFGAASPRAASARAASPKTAGRGGGVTMGHYARGSRRIVPVVECPVHDERGNALAFRLRDAYIRAGVSGGTLKSVAIRAGAHTPEIMATLVVSSDADKTLRAATRRAIDATPPTAFHVNLHPRDDGYVFGKETRRISGSERMRDLVGGTSFLISPTAFFQTNVHAAEILVRLVLEAVPQEGDVLDLYAGSGLFAIPLALAGHAVTAVEENRAAVADGNASLRLNRAAGNRCRFIGRKVEAALPTLRPAPIVVLDPPRDGCTPMVIDQVFARLKPSLAVYISCNPEALGADLGRMAKHGYQIDRIQPVDMFPHTAHIETLVVLTPSRPPARTR